MIQKDLSAIRQYFLRYLAGKPSFLSTQAMFFIGSSVKVAAVVLCILEHLHQGLRGFQELCSDFALHYVFRSLRQLNTDKNGSKKWARCFGKKAVSTVYLPGVPSHPAFTVGPHIGGLCLESRGDTWENAALENKSRLGISWKNQQGESGYMNMKCIVLWDLWTSPRPRLYSPPQTCPPDCAAGHSELYGPLRSAHRTRVSLLHQWWHQHECRCTATWWYPLKLRAEAENIVVL